MKNPTQRTVLVTGGSRGIGRAMVERFKREGWRVAAVSTRASGSEAGADFHYVCDVTQLDQVKATIKKFQADVGQLDVLINNAGLAGENPLSPESGDELWHQIVDVNLNGTYYFCKYSQPLLKDGESRIINIASVLALKGVSDGTAYCAAKHAVLGFTKAFAHYLAPRRIPVNAICPGWTRTDMAAMRLKEIGLSEEKLKRVVPLGRFIEPDEIADMAFHLATSKAGSVMTGQSVTIDGGVLA
jgi:3-hydroxybutyrate dehydrogenase